MTAKVAHKTAMQRRPTTNVVRGGDDLLSLEAAELQPNASKGLARTAADRDSLLGYDGPVLAGAALYRKP